MAWQDIAEQRKQQQADKQQADLHTENIGAVKTSGEDIIAALLRSNTGTKDVKVTNEDLASKSDIDKLLEQLKQIQLSNLLEATKPKQAEPQRAMNITDSAAYVGDAIEKLSKEVMGKLSDETTDISLKQSLTDVQTELVRLSKQITSNDTNKAITGLKKAIDSMELNPTINIPAPKVTVQPSPVDLKPLQATLASYFDKDGDGDNDIDLECYRAQDLTNSGDLQYVGFLNADGGWYIIENDTKKNQLRYVFGDSGYEEAFTRAGSYNYMLLNEAIDAISA